MQVQMSLNDSKFFIRQTFLVSEQIFGMELMILLEFYKVLQHKITYHNKHNIKVNKKLKNESIF